MRFWTLVLVALSFSSLALAQTTAVRGYAGYYGCSGPYVPLVTTPEVSLETVAPSPVGATNATFGLEAGARDSTLSIVHSNVGPTFTQPVWYGGGTTPVIVSPEVQLPFVEPSLEIRERREERREERRQARTRGWTYIASEEATASPVEAAQASKTEKHAARTYTNQDVERQNQNNGLVHYDNKTEQIK